MTWFLSHYKTIIFCPKNELIAFLRGKSIGVMQIQGIELLKFNRSRGKVGLTDEHLKSVRVSRNNYISLYGLYPDGQKNFKISRLSLYPMVFQNILTSYLSSLVSMTYDTTTWCPRVTKSKMSACHKINFAAILQIYETFYCHISSSLRLNWLQ